MTSERTLSAIRFARMNLQMRRVHPRFEASVVAQCANGRTMCSVDGYRETARIIRAAGYKKVCATASGNGITICVEKK